MHRLFGEQREDRRLHSTAAHPAAMSAPEAAPFAGAEAGSTGKAAHALASFV